MDCKETNKLFTAYLDNEVTESERKSIQAHLASCPACRKEVDVLSATQNKFRQTLKMVTDNITPSNQAWTELRQQITQEKEAAVARVLPSGESLGEKPGRISIFSRRLTWRTAIASTLALIIIVSLAVALPTLTGHDEKALAAEIALASPEVQAAFGSGDTSDAKVVNVILEFRTPFVILERNRNTMVVAQVDVDTKEVVKTWIWNITEEEKQKVKTIAESSSEVQNLLMQGAVFRGFTPYYSAHLESDFSNGKQYVSTFEFKATVIMEKGDTRYLVSVSLVGENVTDIQTYSPLKSLYLFRFLLYSVMAAFIVGNILVLVGIKRKNVRALNQASGTSLLSALVGLFGFAVGFTSTTTAFWLIGLPLPLLTLVVSIIGLQHAMNTKKNRYIAIGSAILSSLAIILCILSILAQLTSWSGSSTIPM